MNGMCLRIYTYEFEKHLGILLYEWLLEFAKKHQIEGGTAFRAIAGYGQHHLLHEERFFELGANLPIEIVFYSDEKNISQFLELLKQEKLPVFYVKTPVEYGTIS